MLHPSFLIHRSSCIEAVRPPADLYSVSAVSMIYQDAGTKKDKKAIVGVDHAEGRVTPPPSEGSAEW
jgi:hypothetical protein